MSRPVTLHVYDLSNGMAQQLSAALLGKQLYNSLQIDGIWHTGVVLDGHEYFFGQGIQRTRAGASPFGTPLKVLSLGSTEIPDEMVREYLEDISDRYSAQTYNLLSNNCNNFSDELASFLVGSSIPAHITGLPAEVAATPFGQMIMPMLQPALEERLGNANATSIGPSHSSSRSSMTSGAAQAQQPSTEATADASAPHAIAPPQQVAQGVSSSGAEAAIEEIRHMDPNGNGAQARHAFTEALEDEFVKVQAEGISDPNAAGAEAMKRVMVAVSAGLVMPPE